MSAADNMLSRPIYSMVLLSALQVAIHHQQTSNAREVSQDKTWLYMTEVNL